MTTLHDKNTVQIHSRTLRTEKYIHKEYNSTFRHVNHRKQRIYKII